MRFDQDYVRPLLHRHQRLHMLLPRVEGDQWIVGRLSADKSMSHSLCLVRPNTPGADHSLPAYKLKQIALSMLYYLRCCWTLFQSSHSEVVPISQTLMTEASTSFTCLRLRMSNDHHHEFMGSAANEWSVIHCCSVCQAFITAQKHHLCLQLVHKAQHVRALLWKDWRLCDSDWFTDLTRGCFFNQDSFSCGVFTQGTINSLVVL